MNINLIYLGNNYNFDLRRDANIKYIQGLASKLISKDSSTFHLLYKKNCLSDYDDTTLIKDLTKDDNNISITITQKNKISLLSNDNIRKLKVKDLNLDQSKNSITSNNTKIMLNSPLVSPVNLNNKNLSLNKNILQKKGNKNEIEYISENKVFEEVYNLKENELLSLMKKLSQKIKEYDDILYKQFKNNSKINNELSLYEKAIIDFKDKQIKFMKKLLNFFSNEKDFIAGLLSLTEFYKELKQYSNPKSIVLYNNTDYNKNKLINNINTKNLSKTDSKIKLNVSNNLYITKQDKKLPLLPNAKVKSNKYFLSNNNNTISSVDSNENNSDFGDEKNFFKDHIFNSDNKQKKAKNLIKENKKNILNKTENKETNINNNLDKNIITRNDNNNSIKNYNINKAFSQCNTNDQTNTSHNTTIQGKITNTNIINNKKNQSKNNLLNNSKIKQISKRINTLNNKKENKLNVLFEEQVNNDNKDKISNDNSDSSELSDKTSRRKFSNDSKRNENEENNHIFRKTKKNKREKGKIKNLINNIYDFLI